jgi:hypothetical protein
MLRIARRTLLSSSGTRASAAPAVEPHDCAGSAVLDVTMFGSLSRPGEPRPAATNYLFNFSNSHFTVVPAKAGTHKHRPSLLRESRRQHHSTCATRRMGPCLPPSLKLRRPDDPAPAKPWRRRVAGTTLLNERAISSPRRVTPGLSKYPSPEEGVGNAGWPTHPQPRVENRKHASVVTAGTRRFHPAFPHANGFNGFLRARPGDRALLSPWVTTLARCTGYQRRDIRPTRLRRPP